MLVGYARTSTTDQKAGLDAQVEAREYAATIRIAERHVLEDGHTGMSRKS